MVTLSGDVVAAGIRANQFQRVYETVAAMLAATDTIADGELVQAGQYFYEGAGAATDHDVTNAGGSKLYCLANPYVTPDQFGAPGRTNDETSYVNAAVASGKPVFLNRIYDVTTVVFPPNTNSIIIHGAGSSEGVAGGGLYGRSDTAEAILQTFTTGNAADSLGHHLANFTIFGHGKRGLAAIQVIGSVFENIAVLGDNNGTPRKAGILVESSFSNLFRLMRVQNGSRVSLQIGGTVLDTIFDLLYTADSVAQNNIYIDAAQHELSAQASGGNGEVTFNMPTLQGTNGYGIRISQFSNVLFTNIYWEGNEGAILIEGADNAVFQGSRIFGDNAGHVVWIGNSIGSTTNVSFDGCTSTAGDKIVVDNGLSQLAISNSTADMFGTENILASTDTYSLGGAAVNLSAVGGTRIVNGMRKKNEKAVLTFQSSDAASFVDMTVNAAGTVAVSAPYTLANVTEYPLEPVVTFAGFGVAMTNGVAISTLSHRCVGGTAPYTWSEDTDNFLLSGMPPGLSINSSTGDITGTPTTPGSYVWRVKVVDANGMVGRSRYREATVT